MFGTGILDDIFTGGQGKANKFNSQLLGQMNQLFAGAQQQIGSYAGLAQGDLMRALMAGNQSYDAAKGEIGRLGDSARSNIAATGEKAAGTIEQGLVNSGLGAGSAGAFAQRGLASDTARALADVDATLAQMYANLEMQHGAAQSGVLTNKANVNLGTGQALASSMQTQGLNLSNYFAQGGQSIFSMAADAALGYAGFSSLFG